MMFPKRQRPLLWLFLGLVWLFSAGAAEAAAGLPDLVGLVKKLKPVVVNISTTQNHTKGVHGGGKMSPDAFKNSPFDEFFRRFMEQIPQESQKSRSLGSGVIIDPDGYILTNHHVVSDADEIQVRLSDEREFSARVVGSDAKTDLALIRIDKAGVLPVAALGNSDTAEVGSWVVAIGNPFGLDATVTAGIISARGRVIGNGPYDNFLQTDAAINPGNSGGPLFNLDGEVVGINTAIFSRSGGSMGIGFAIPVNMAKTVMVQLKDNGRVTRGWLGVRIQTVTQELADALGLKKRQGALVASVEPDSPAAAAGVQAGDVIIEFDGQEVDRMKSLPAIVAETPVKKRVKMVVVRDGRPKTLDVTVAELADKPEEQAAAEKDNTSALGMSLHPLTEQLRERLELDDKAHGVVVAKVDPDGIAAEAGIRTGDLIAEINRKPIRDVAAFRKATDGLKPGKTLLILLIRGGDPVYMALGIPKE